MAFELFRKKDLAKQPQHRYDPEKVEPVIRSSICTGEKVAGFRDKKTGHLEEVMLIQTDRDLDTFRKQYGIEGKIETIY